MALTQTQVSQLYVAIFNRASEGEGNTYWQTAIEGAATTATEMLATDAAKAYFGTSLDTDQAFIEHIYKNTLGKTYAEDKAGIDYWVSLLADGKSKGEVIVALIEAAQAPENKGAAQDMFNNKVEVSNYTALKIEEAGDDLTIFQDFISGVTSDKKSVDKSKEAIDKEANQEITGETKFLTVGQDILSGTNDNDVFVSYVSQNQFGQQVNTLGSGDVINGGAGTDTLDAQITAGAWAGNTSNGNMAITPITKSVENIILHADIADYSSSNNDTVIVDGKNMDGVLKIASNYSDASLVIKNMIGSKKGVYGGTAEQTIAMEYTGNKDSNWKESDMTVFYDQDYLVRSAIESNSLYYFTQDRLATQQNKKPFGENTAVDGIKFRINEKETIVIKIADDKLTKFLKNVPTNGVEAYKQFAQLLSEALEEKNAELGGKLDGFSITLDETYFRTHGGENNGGDKLDQNAYAIVLTAPDNVKIDQPAMSNVDKFLPTYDMYNDTSADRKASDTPVKVNVDLEKVGLAADGGALTIGSMNKDGQNVFGNNQGITTTDTVAGFDEFNVHVAGDKSKNSSLSALQSTDNTLRKVTIDSKVGSNANLTIGNSNTNVDFDSSANNAKALKDVQIVDASTFAGNLTLNAGFTNEIVEKYLANTTETTLYGLNNAKTELAEFKYNGGNGDDKLNLALGLVGFAEENFTHANNTNGLNVFKMNIDGGKGNDTIILDADAAGSATLTATNITIDGGLGNDIIDISEFASSWTYNVAFSGAHFGHDTVKGFNTGVVEITDEAQNIDLTGFVAHVNEVIVVTIGDQVYQHTVTGADMSDTAIATQVATMLSAGGVSKAFDTATSSGKTIVDMTKADANVNSVTVEVQKHKEVSGTFDKDMEVIHSAISNTTKQGGLLEGTGGADTLDFSAYNVNAVKIIGGAKAQVSTLKAGDSIIYLEQSAHDAGVYNVYKTVAVDNVANHTVKGDIIGSINLDSDATGTAVNYNNIDATQLLF